MLCDSNEACHFKLSHFKLKGVYLESASKSISRDNDICVSI